MLLNNQNHPDFLKTRFLLAGFYCVPREEEELSTLCINVFSLNWGMFSTSGDIMIRFMVTLRPEKSLSIVKQLK